jgi:hypothetical protein
MLDVMNLVYMNGSVTDALKRGTVVCLPKKPDPGGPEVYRPLTLLNADYKLLSRKITSAVQI